ncbi:MAG: hypothetical protein ACRDUB_01465 [Mycobacterium sp.]
MSGPSKPSRDVVNAIFGEELPSTTRDERAEDLPADASERDRWLRDNVPPHHG